ncbi:hypothetical protein ACTXT7_011276 [Hymenolepis weldensis]
MAFESLNFCFKTEHRLKKGRVRHWEEEIRDAGELAGERRNKFFDVLYFLSSLKEMPTTFGLGRYKGFPKSTPRSCSKLAKSEEGGAAIRKYSPAEETVDLRRKPSNRQLQHLLSPAANEAGLPPSLFINAHLPSSSRQFTLDPSTVPHDSFDGDAEDDQGPPCTCRNIRITGICNLIKTYEGNERL